MKTPQKKGISEAAARISEELQECWAAIVPSRGGKSQIQNIRGERFGLLVAVERQGSDEHGSALWFCKCDCGGDRVVPRSKLRKGRVKSCGCLGNQSAESRLRGAP